MYLKCVNTKDYINNGSNVHRHTFSNVCTTCKFHKWNGKVYSAFFSNIGPVIVFGIKVVSTIFFLKPKVKKSQSFHSFEKSQFFFVHFYSSKFLLFRIICRQRIMGDRKNYLNKGKFK